jgi:branched-chain amino acid aminotransferase
VGGGPITSESYSWRVVEGPEGLRLEPHPEVVGSLSEAGRFLPQGAYTTLRTYGRTGLLALGQHLDRLEETARLLGHPVTLPRDELRRLLCEVLRGLEWEASSETRLRLTVDCAERVGEIWCSVEPLPLPSPEDYVKGVAVLTRPMHRENPKAKDNAFIAASREARALLGPEVNEVLMVGPEGRILEGLSSNFYGVRGGTIWTAEEGVLPGITRSLILEEAARAEIPVELQALTLDQLATLDEAFLSSTSRAVLPIARIDGQQVGAGAPGPLTRQLGQLYEARLQQSVEWLCEE